MKKYYIASRTFLINTDKGGKIETIILKIKAKTRDEAIEIFDKHTRKIGCNQKGGISCERFKDMKVYTNYKKRK